MKKFLFKTTIIILIINGSLNAQTPDWIWANQTDTNSVGKYFGGIDIDASGNIYAVGLVNVGSTTIGCITVIAAATNVVLVKYNKAGQVIWIRNTEVGNNSYPSMDVKVDPSGNPVIMGNFRSSTVTFGNITLNNAGGEDLYVVKFDSSGTVLWAQSFGETGDDEAYINMCFDISGNIYIPGQFHSTIVIGSYIFSCPTGFGDGFIIKLSATTGNVIFANQYTGWLNDGPCAIATDSRGNFYVSGEYTENNGLFASLPAVTGGGSMGFIIKYDSSNIVQWIRAIVSNGNFACRPYIIKTDKNGNLYVSGWHSNTTQISFDTFILPFEGGYIDAFIAKYDSSGTVIWAKTLAGNGDDGNEKNLSIDTNGYPWISFRSSSTSLTLGSYSFSNPSGTDMFLCQLDTVNGDFLVANQFGNTSGISANGLAIDTLDAIYLAGNFSGLSPINLSTLFLTSNNIGDCFVAKHAEFISLTCVAPDSLCNGAAFTVSYTKTGIYNNGNIFTAQLSDSSGNFCNAIDIGSVTSVASGNISTTIPVSLSGGNGYRIRVNSSNPLFIGRASDSIFISGQIASIYYRDADGDSFGDPLHDTLICEILAGYVIDNTDCDDSNHNIHPGATEICGNVDDENCDGIAENVDATIMVDINTLTSNQTNGTYQWVNCNNNYQTISGATNQTFTTTIGGLYAVVVTNGICFDTSVCADITGLKNINSSDDFLFIYPNPVSDLIYVQMPINCLINTIKIYNQIGQLVNTEELLSHVPREIKINADKLPDGIYNVLIETEKGMVKCKFIKIEN